MRATFRSWLKDEEAVAAVEAALLLPLMASLLMAIVDLGTGINISQKVVNATATMADLLTRDEDVSNTEFNEAVAAGQLTFEPYDFEPMGYDIVGIQFLTAAETPTVIWRDTYNMDINADITTGATGLGDQDEGVVAVTVRYVYEPLFASFLTGDIEMQEVFYARGRRSGLVTRSS